MKQVTSLIYSLIFSVICFGQSKEYGDVNTMDSLELLKAWNVFIAAVKDRDSARFNSLSAEIITLTNLYQKDSGRKYDLPREKVRTILFKSLQRSLIWSLIEKNKFTLSYSTSGDFDTYKMRRTKKKTYRIFKIAFDNTETQDENFGMGCSFEFIRIDNRFYYKELVISSIKRIVYPNSF